MPFPADIKACEALTEKVKGFRKTFNTIKEPGFFDTKLTNIQIIERLSALNKEIAACLDTSFGVNHIEFNVYPSYRKFLEAQVNNDKRVAPISTAYDAIEKLRSEIAASLRNTRDAIAADEAKQLTPAHVAAAKRRDPLLHLHNMLGRDEDSAPDVAPLTITDPLGLGLSDVPVDPDTLPASTQPRNNSTSSGAFNSARGQANSASSLASPLGLGGGSGEPDRPDLSTLTPHPTVTAHFQFPPAAPTVFATVGIDHKHSAAAAAAEGAAPSGTTVAPASAGDQKRADRKVDAKPYNRGEDGAVEIDVFFFKDANKIAKVFKAAHISSCVRRKGGVNTGTYITPRREMHYISIVKKMPDTKDDASKMYRNGYLYLSNTDLKQLFFIKHDGETIPVAIKNIPKFNASLAKIMGEASRKFLDSKQEAELIRANCEDYWRGQKNLVQDDVQIFGLTKCLNEDNQSLGSPAKTIKKVTIEVPMDYKDVFSPTNLQRFTNYLAIPYHLTEHNCAHLTSLVLSAAGLLQANRDDWSLLPETMIKQVCDLERPRILAKREQILKQLNIETDLGFIQQLKLLLENDYKLLAVEGHGKVSGTLTKDGIEFLLRSEITNFNKAAAALETAIQLATQILSSDPENIARRIETLQAILADLGTDYKDLIDTDNRLLNKSHLSPVLKTTITPANYAVYAAKLAPIARARKSTVDGGPASDQKTQAPRLAAADIKLDNATIERGAQFLKEAILEEQENLVTFTSTPHFVSHFKIVWDALFGKDAHKQELMLLGAIANTHPHKLNDNFAARTAWLNDPSSAGTKEQKQAIERFIKIFSEHLVNNYNNDPNNKGSKLVNAFLNNPEKLKVLCKTLETDKYAAPTEVTTLTKELFKQWQRSKPEIPAEQFVAQYQSTPAIANTATIDTKREQVPGAPAPSQASSTARAEAIYQQYLITKSLQQPQQHPRFDPQGHIVTEVTLTNADYLNIYNQVKPADEKSVPTADNAKMALEIELGVSITDTTYCNVDIKNNAQLKENFKAWFKESHTTADSKTEDAAINALLTSPHTSSVIALQEEMEMYMRLASRVIETHFVDANAVNAEAWKTIRNTAAAAINLDVRAAFHNALMSSYNPARNTIDFAALNKALDNARETVGAKCYPALVTACATHIADFKTKYDAIKSQINKHAFETTTATADDYLRTDNRNQTVTRINATTETAHNKQVEKTAHRIIRRGHLDEKGIVTPNKRSQVECRTPSLAVKGNEQVVVDDVAYKLKNLHEEFQRAAGNNYQGPMIYNLLTSFPMGLAGVVDDKKNHQPKSAERILKGAHKYNRVQIKKHTDTNALCYVQNIPINQHTHTLALDAKTGVIAEATLMAEMAMLSTLVQHQASLPSAISTLVNNTYNQATSLYKLFLSIQGVYFKDSDQGKILIPLLDSLKDEIKKPEYTAQFSQANKSLEQLAAQALLQIFANKLHLKKQFGTLAQTLSVFLQPIALYGCKSGNERFQSVSGRVGLLHSLNGRTPTQRSTCEHQFIMALQSFISNPNTQISNLQKTLDIAYKEHNLQGAQAAVSENDQGAPSKVIASSNKAGKINKREIDTNIAESGYLTWLSQKNAAALQAHNSSDQAKKLNTAVATTNTIQTLDSKLQGTNTMDTKHSSSAINTGAAAVAAGDTKATPATGNTSPAKNTRGGSSKLASMGFNPNAQTLSGAGAAPTPSCGDHKSDAKDDKENDEQNGVEIIFVFSEDANIKALGALKAGHVGLFVCSLDGKRKTYLSNPFTMQNPEDDKTRHLEAQRGNLDSCLTSIHLDNNSLGKGEGKGTKFRVVRFQIPDVNYSEITRNITNKVRKPYELDQFNCAHLARDVIIEIATAAGLQEAEIRECLGEYEANDLLLKPKTITTRVLDFVRNTLLISNRAIIYRALEDQELRTRTFGDDKITPVRKLKALLENDLKLLEVEGTGKLKFEIHKDDEKSQTKEWDEATRAFELLEIAYRRITPNGCSLLFANLAPDAKITAEEMRRITKLPFDIPILIKQGDVYSIFGNTNGRNWQLTPLQLEGTIHTTLDRRFNRKPYGATELLKNDIFIYGDLYREITAKRGHTFTDEWQQIIAVLRELNEANKSISYPPKTDIQWTKLAADLASAIQFPKREAETIFKTLVLLATRGRCTVADKIDELARNTQNPSVILTTFQTDTPGKPIEVAARKLQKLIAQAHEIEKAFAEHRGCTAMLQPFYDSTITIETELNALEVGNDLQKELKIRPRNYRGLIAEATTTLDAKASAANAAANSTAAMTLAAAVAAAATSAGNNHQDHKHSNTSAAAHRGEFPTTLAAAQAITARFDGQYNRIKRNPSVRKNPQPAQGQVGILQAGESHAPTINNDAAAWREHFVIVLSRINSIDQIVKTAIIDELINNTLPRLRYIITGVDFNNGNPGPTPSARSLRRGSIAVSQSNQPSQDLHPATTLGNFPHLQIFPVPACTERSDKMHRIIHFQMHLQSHPADFVLNRVAPASDQTAQKDSSDLNRRWYEPLVSNATVAAGVPTEEDSKQYSEDERKKYLRHINHRALRMLLQQTPAIAEILITKLNAQNQDAHLLGNIKNPVVMDSADYLTTTFQGYITETHNNLSDNATAEKLAATTTQYCHLLNKTIACLRRELSPSANNDEKFAETEATFVAALAQPEITPENFNAARDALITANKQHKSAVKHHLGEIKWEQNNNRLKLQINVIMGQYVTLRPLIAQYPANEELNRLKDYLDLACLYINCINVLARDTKKCDALDYRIFETSLIFLAQLSGKTITVCDAKPNELGVHLTAFSNFYATHHRYPCIDNNDDRNELRTELGLTATADQKLAGANVDNDDNKREVSVFISTADLPPAPLRPASTTASAYLAAGAGSGSSSDDDAASNSSQNSSRRDSNENAADANAKTPLLAAATVQPGASNGSAGGRKSSLMAPPAVTVSVTPASQSASWWSSCWPKKNTTPTTERSALLSDSKRNRSSSADEDAPAAATGVGSGGAGDFKIDMPGATPAAASYHDPIASDDGSSLGRMGVAAPGALAQQRDNPPPRANRCASACSSFWSGVGNCIAWPFRTAASCCSAGYEPVKAYGEGNACYGVAKIVTWPIKIAAKSIGLLPADIQPPKNALVFACDNVPEESEHLSLQQQQRREDEKKRRSCARETDRLLFSTLSATAWALFFTWFAAQVNIFSRSGSLPPAPAFPIIPDWYPPSPNIIEEVFGILNPEGSNIAVEIITNMLNGIAESIRAEKAFAELSAYFLSQLENFFQDINQLSFWLRIAVISIAARLGFRGGFDMRSIPVEKALRELRREINRLREELRREYEDDHVQLPDPLRADEKHFVHVIHPNQLHDNKSAATTSGGSAGSAASGSADSGLRSRPRMALKKLPPAAAASVTNITNLVQNPYNDSNLNARVGALESKPAPAPVTTTNVVQNPYDDSKVKGDIAVLGNRVAALETKPLFAPPLTMQRAVTITGQEFVPGNVTEENIEPTAPVTGIIVPGQSTVADNKDSGTLPITAFNDSDLGDLKRRLNDLARQVAALTRRNDSAANPLVNVTDPQYTSTSTAQPAPTGNLLVSSTGPDADEKARAANLLVNVATNTANAPLSAATLTDPQNTSTSTAQPAPTGNLVASTVGPNADEIAGAVNPVVASGIAPSPATVNLHGSPTTPPAAAAIAGTTTTNAPQLSGATLTDPQNTSTSTAQPAPTGNLVASTVGPNADEIAGAVNPVVASGTAPSPAAVNLHGSPTTPPAAAAIAGTTTTNAPQLSGATLADTTNTFTSGGGDPSDLAPVVGPATTRPDLKQGDIKKVPASHAAIEHTAIPETLIAQLMKITSGKVHFDVTERNTRLESKSGLVKIDKDSKKMKDFLLDILDKAAVKERTKQLQSGISIVNIDVTGAALFVFKFTHQHKLESAQCFLFDTNEADQTLINAIAQVALPGNIHITPSAIKCDDAEELAENLTNKTKAIVRKHSVVPSTAPAAASSQPQQLTATRTADASGNVMLSADNKDAKAAQLHKEIDVPHDGTCLFYSVVLSALLPVVNQKNAFDARCTTLFGATMTAEEKTRLASLLKTYDGNAGFFNQSGNLLTKLIDGETTDEEPIATNGKLRNTLAQHINAHKKLATPQVYDAKLGDLDDKDGKEGYLTRMKKSGTYGGELEIAAFADMLKMHISVFDDAQNNLAHRHAFGVNTNGTIHLVFTKADASARQNNHFKYLLKPEVLANLKAGNGNAAISVAAIAGGGGIHAAVNPRSPAPVAGSTTAPAPTATAAPSATR